jgi:hypothetical protein
MFVVLEDYLRTDQMKVWRSVSANALSVRGFKKYKGILSCLVAFLWVARFNLIRARVLWDLSDFPRISFDMVLMILYLVMPFGKN